VPDTDLGYVKMKKLFFSYVIMLVAFVMSFVMITSCGTDDDKTPSQETPSQNSSIVGTWTWQETEGNYFFRESITFKSDNTFTCVGIEKYDNDEGTFTSYGSYIYTSSKNELIIIDDYATEKKGTHFYTILLNKNSLTLIEKDGDKCGPYEKQ